jgi:hypothetical protein
MITIKNITSALAIAVLVSINCVAAAEKQQGFHNLECEGAYSHHLQGICTNECDTVYWSFTTTLVKTDRDGKLLKKIAVANHHGDLCHLDGKLYVAVNLGPFNSPKGNADSWVYIYNADDLSLIRKHRTEQAIYGAGGIAFANGHFYLVGGLPPGVNENYVYRYDRQFNFLEKHVIKSGHTLMGIQTATYANGHFWFGCYGTPCVMLKIDKSLQNPAKFNFDCSLGIVALPDGRFLVARGWREKGGRYHGGAAIARQDEAKGLVIIQLPDHVRDMRGQSWKLADLDVSVQFPGGGF